MVQSLYELSNWNARIILADDSIEQPSGIITDLTLPTLEREMDTTKRAGELGVVSRPSYFSEVELSFTIKNTYAGFFEALVTGMNQSITLEANTCIIPDTGTPTAYVVSGKGFVSSLPLGDLSADGMEAEITMMCWYVTADLGGVAMIYDPRNYILSLDGTNLFAGIKDVIEPPIS